MYLNFSLVKNRGSINQAPISFIIWKTEKIHVIKALLTEAIEN